VPSGSSISPDVLARYAADAAREVAGVHGLVGNTLQRHDGVRVSRQGDEISVELQLAVGAGASAPEVAALVQARVAQTLAAMAGVTPAAVDVVVAQFASAR
jgi:uncharacterized alkaline shock family protein YloU